MGCRERTGCKRTRPFGKRAGSALLYVMVMVISIAIIVTVVCDLGMSSITTQRRYEDFVAASRTWDAAVSQIDADNTAGSLSLPNSRVFSLNGVSGTVTTVDNSANIANTNLATGTLTTSDGREYVESAVLAKQNVISPWSYAMFANGALSGAHSFTSGSAGTHGDIFFNGNITTAPGTTINGDAISTGTIDNNATITGTKSQNAEAPCFFPGVDPTDYSGVATTTYAADATFNGITFSTPASGQPYDVIFVNGNLNIKGTVTNVGTIYCKGNVTVNGNMTYANSNSHIAIITPHNINLNQNNVVGYYYCGQTLQCNFQTLTGSVCGVVIQVPKTGVITFDNFVKSNSNNGVLMHLPGLWPSTTDLQVQANAPATLVGNNIQMTSGGNNQTSTAYVTTKQSINTFNVSFNFQFSSTSGEGFTFVIQNNALNTVAGPASQGAGLGFQSMNKSFAIKFDQHNDAGEGTSSTGAYNNGAAPTNTGSIDMTSSGITIGSNTDPCSVTLSYDGTTLTETVTDLVTSSVFTQQYTVNIGSITGSTTDYIGFSASTGNSSATQNTITISNFTYGP